MVALNDLQQSLPPQLIDDLKETLISYLFFQDTGACVAIMHVKVYYKFCDKTTRNLSSFERTTTGRDLTSLVEAKGSCVRNSATVSYGSICLNLFFVI